MFEYLNLKLTENDYSINDLRVELKEKPWGAKYLDVMATVESLAVSKVDGFSFISVSIPVINHMVFSKDIDRMIDCLKRVFWKNMLIEVRAENAVKVFSFSSIGKKAESPWIYLEGTNVPDENAHRIVAFIDNLRLYFFENLGKNRLSADYVFDRVSLSLMPYKLIPQSKANKCTKRAMSHEFSSEWAGEYVVLIDNGYIELESLYHLYRKVDVEKDNGIIPSLGEKMSSKAFFSAIASELK